MPAEHRAALKKRNALHAAELHIEIGNAPKIAESLKELPALEALEYLFAQAERHRLAGKHGKAATILEAAKLIDRSKGTGAEISLEIEGSGTNETTTLSVRRLTPAELFTAPIE